MVPRKIDWAIGRWDGFLVTNAAEIGAKFADPKSKHTGADRKYLLLPNLPIKISPEKNSWLSGGGIPARRD